MEQLVERKVSRILILDANKQDAARLETFLHGHWPSVAINRESDPVNFSAALHSADYDIVILDPFFQNGNAISILQEARLFDIVPGLLVLSSSLDPRQVASLINAGCQRCIIKDGDWTVELPVALRQLTSLRRLEVENERLVSRLTETNGLLAEKNRRLDEFSGTVAHDIRGPLGGISMKLEYIKDIYGEDFDERFKKIIDGTLDSTRRLLNVVQAMYEYAKISSRAYEVEEINLAVFIEEIIADLSFNPSLDIQIGLSDLPVIYGNPGLLRKVFQNLISNAVKYNDKRTTYINIFQAGVCERDDVSYSQIKVQDNGPGIPKEDQKDIFAMFRRGNTAATTDVEGVGIGLAVVKRIVELHRGTIDVESEPGQGASFVFTLPIDKIELQK